MSINKRVVPTTLLIPSAFSIILYSCVVDMTPKRKVASIPEVGEPSGSHMKRDDSSLTEREGTEPLFDCGMP